MNRFEWEANGIAKSAGYRNGIAGELTRRANAARYARLAEDFEREARPAPAPAPSIDLPRWIQRYEAARREVTSQAV